MTTEKELKDQCTPDIIKKMCELTEGFKYFDSGKRFQFERKLYNIDDAIAFPLLIHRAVEGWNKNGDPILIANNKVVYPMTVYLFNNYQPENLTHAECACLHCMLDIFKEEK